MGIIRKQTKGRRRSRRQGRFDEPKTVRRLRRAMKQKLALAKGEADGEDESDRRGGEEPSLSPK